MTFSLSTTFLSHCIYLSRISRFSLFMSLSCWSHVVRVCWGREEIAFGDAVEERERENVARIVIFLTSSSIKNLLQWALKFGSVRTENPQQQLLALSRKFSEISIVESCGRKFKFLDNLNVIKLSNFTAVKASRHKSEKSRIIKHSHLDSTEKSTFFYSFYTKKSLCETQQFSHETNAKKIVT